MTTEPTMWEAFLPMDTDPIEGLTLVGQTITVAAEHVRSVRLPGGDWKPCLTSASGDPWRGVVRLVLPQADGVAVQCDSIPAPPTRECRFCGNQIDLTLWNAAGDDHGVFIQGPLSIESVATKSTGEAVRFRAAQPFLVVYCSQFDRTLQALHIRQEDRRD